jgi:hypothetical protein
MKFVSNPAYKPPKGLGYFMNVLAKLDTWLDREERRGSDFHRFTKVQLRRIALYLERNYLFNFDALRADHGEARRRAERLRVQHALERGLSNVSTGRWNSEVPQMALQARSSVAPVTSRVRPSYEDQVREFKRIVKDEKKEIPQSVLDEFLI